MAAVTVDRYRNNKMGNRTVITATIDVATTGDTWDTKLKIVEGWANSPEANLTSISESAGTITFTTGGAITDMMVTVIGL